MQTALGELSKQQLIALVERQQNEQLYLKAQIEQYKRMLFGQKRERFEADASQLALPFEASPEQKQQQEEILTEKIEYVRKKRSSHKGRVALPTIPGASLRAQV